MTIPIEIIVLFLGSAIAVIGVIARVFWVKLDTMEKAWMEFAKHREKVDTWHMNITEQVDEHDTSIRGLIMSNEDRIREIAKVDHKVEDNTRSIIDHGKRIGAIEGKLR